MSTATDYDPSLKDVNDNYKLYVTLSITTAALVLSSVLRINVRVRHASMLGWDDLFMILGTCLNVVASGFDYAGATYGFGRHQQFLSETKLIQARKYSELAVLIAILAILLIKMSICFFLLRLIERTHRVFFWFTWFLMGFTTITSLITCILWGLQSRPLPGLWDPRISATRVSSRVFVQFSYVFYAFTAVTDLFYALSPIYFLRGVQIEKRRKAGILTLIGLGILIAIVSILKIAFANELSDAGDLTWSQMKLYLCSIIERNIGGFVANLPTLNYLFLKVFGTWSERGYYKSKRRLSLHSNSDKDDERLRNALNMPPGASLGSRGGDPVPLHSIDRSTHGRYSVQKDLDRYVIDSDDSGDPESEMGEPEAGRGVPQGWIDPTIDPEAQHHR